MGKTAVLNLLRQRLELPTILHTIEGKLLTERALAENLACALGLTETSTIDALVSELRAGLTRVFLLDEVHNLFLRKVGGYEAFEALVRLVRQTSRHVFWLVGCNAFAWQFLYRIRPSTMRNRLSVFHNDIIDLSDRLAVPIGLQTSGYRLQDCYNVPYVRSQAILPPLKPVA